MRYAEPVRVLLPILGACSLFAHDPVTTRLTWSAEISRIVYKRCAACHRDGGKAPMALLDYEQVRPWAKAMRDEVLARRMPPWGAVKGYGEFQDDPSLTQDEINRIAEWVEGGAPEGDPRFLPPKPAATADKRAAAKGSRIRSPSKTARSLRLTAIAPSGDIPAAKVYARRPDGTIEPLLWLIGYQDKWRRTYVYKAPVHLPAGTVIESTPAIQFSLITLAGNPRAAPTKSAKRGR